MNIVYTFFRFVIALPFFLLGLAVRILPSLLVLPLAFCIAFFMGALAIAGAIIKPKRG